MNICETERGNTLLVNGDSFVAWLDLGNHVRLEVSWVPDNYPALNVQTIKRTQEELAEHINTRCVGWDVRKCHIDGVNIVLGYVADPEEE